MDDDVDMDAPQISTLREEETPPPKANPKLRVKLVVKDKAGSSSASASRHRQQQPQSTIHDDDGEEEDEDQEDQLIDDDDMRPIPAAGLPPPRVVEPKRKVPAKRKPRRNEKRPPEEGRLREKVMQQPGAPNLAPTILCFETNPEYQDPGQVSEAGQLIVDTDSVDPSLSVKVTGKKKAAAKKAPAPKKPKPAPASAPISKPKVRLIPPPMPEDSGIISEGMTGTAASSPVVGQYEDVDPSPEPEAAPALPPPAPVPPAEDINLEGTPVPVYPLPTKPFPVLPPQKISTGFAPVLTIDRSSPQVRHWRVAKREIRGIGGGRWFTKAWVGSKESPYANQMEAQSELRKAAGDTATHLAIPRLAAVSISAPVTGKKGKGKASSSLSASVGPSRSESLAPDSAVVRAPSKMRISQMAPSSEAGDSDMMGPPGS